MTYRDRFYARKEHFNSVVKTEILNELNKKFHTYGLDKYGQWLYEDGYFYFDVQDEQELFILSGDFEPYTFDRLACLLKDSSTEFSVNNVEEVVQILVDHIQL